MISPTVAPVVVNNTYLPLCFLLGCATLKFLSYDVLAMYFLLRHKNSRSNCNSLIIVDHLQRGIYFTSQRFIGFVIFHLLKIWSQPTI